ncbi:hypothetical protein SBA6_870021 [Candidatus Sulfopaludibacter sp. SbA6]|nr:hypothetical protein SBA6_870021 [Candidatus Sulfopaludibacter sp. SbA6]
MLSWFLSQNRLKINNLYALTDTAPPDLFHFEICFRNVKSCVKNSSGSNGSSGPDAPHPLEGSRDRWE